VLLSEQMLEMAHQSQWLQFEDTEQQRQKILTTIFEHNAITEMLPKIAHFMQQILDIDNESIQLSELARREIMHELSTLHSNGHAVSAYQENSSFEPIK